MHKIRRIKFFQASGKTGKYFILGLLSFVIISVSAIQYSNSPNYEIPGVAAPASDFQFPRINFNLCPIFPFLPLCQDPTPTQSRNNNTPAPPSLDTSVALVSFVMLLLFLAFIIVTVFFVVRFLHRKFISTTLIKGVTKSVEEKVEGLKFSRNRAETLLKLALETGEYTTGIIDAYIALDESLDDFREIARPKHWTPKEYAVSVEKPVFRPTVYKIVEKFYEIRYGLRLAERADVNIFLELLYKLFDTEIPSNEKEEMLNEFEKIQTQLMDYNIPAKGNLFKPQRGR